VKYVETIKTDGLRVQKAYKEVVQDEPQTDKKAKVRYEIENNIFDIRDSVADNAKMISLLFSMVYRMYEAMPEEYKQNLSEQDRQMIEFAINEFKNVQTWGDLKIQKEGTNAIISLMQRQNKVGQVIQQVYGM